MRTFKEHILEKLKVTKVNGFIIPTYKEFYDLLDEYCKTTHKPILDLTDIFGFDEPMPIYKDIKHKSISTIKPVYYSYPEMYLDVYDSTIRHSFTYCIKVSEVLDKEVDFMEAEYIEMVVKYMKEHIK